MQKVIVVGPSGAGKSAFSRNLGSLLDLPVTHLDNVYWNHDRTHISPEEFDERLEELLRGDKWILDGDYSRTYERRIVACDTVFFLDYPLDTCLEGAARRVGIKRVDLPWVPDEFDADFELSIRRWDDKNHETLMGLLERYSEGRNIIIFHSRQEGDAYLSSLRK